MLKTKPKSWNGFLTFAQTSWFGNTVNSWIDEGFAEGLALFVLFLQRSDVREF